MTYLADIANWVSKNGVHTDTLIAWGDPATNIEKVVKEQRVDLIAIATHGRMEIDLFTHGSTTDAMLHHVEIPMLNYHQRGCAPVPAAVPACGAVKRHDLGTDHLFEE